MQLMFRAIRWLHDPAPQIPVNFRNCCSRNDCSFGKIVPQSWIKQIPTFTFESLTNESEQHLTAKVTKRGALVTVHKQRVRLDLKIGVADFSWNIWFHQLYDLTWVHWEVRFPQWKQHSSKTKRDQNTAEIFIFSNSLPFPGLFNNLQYTNPKIKFAIKSRNWITWF